MSQLRRRSLSKIDDFLKYPDHFYFNWRSGAAAGFEDASTIHIGINGIKFHIDSLIVDGVTMDPATDIVYTNSVDYIEPTKDYHEIYFRVIPYSGSATISIQSDTFVRLPYHSHIIGSIPTLGVRILMAGLNGEITILDETPDVHLNLQFKDANGTIKNDYRLDVLNSIATHYSHIYIPTGSSSAYSTALKSSLMTITEERDFKYKPIIGSGVLHGTFGTWFLKDGFGQQSRETAFYTDVIELKKDQAIVFGGYANANCSAIYKVDNGTYTNLVAGKDGTAKKYYFYKATADCYVGVCSSQSSLYGEEEVWIEGINVPIIFDN